jgi:hypothetical protein
MIQIDRMALADLGNSREIAKVVLQQLGEVRPPIPIDEIAGAAGISDIQTLQTAGFEGALITDDCKSDGTILVSVRGNPERRRFTIGHELGHFLNPWHKPPAGGFKCTKADMFSTEGGSARLNMEVEANVFSAEMLMPEKLFRRDVNKLNSPGLEHIVELAGRYATSKLATARRFVDLYDEPAVIVLSKDGAVVQVHWHKAFPYLGLRQGRPIPAKSLTATFIGEGDGCSDSESVEPSLWIQGSLRRNAEMYEQVLVQSGGYRITLLTIDQTDSDDEDEEYVRERSEWNPSFRK